MVANQQWCDLFPHAEANVLANRVSDHNPITITLTARGGGEVKMKRPFRYEARWSKLGGIKEVVKKVWRVKTQEVDPWKTVKEK
jgi:hypothetical protein